VKTLALGLSLLLASAIGAESRTSRSQIEAAYAKSARAIRLRFLDGAIHHRDSGFRAVDPQGHRIDMQLERKRLERFFSKAITIEEKYQLLDFREPKPGVAEVKVSSRIELTLLDPASRKPMLVYFETRSQDSWSLQGQDWRLRHSVLEKQEARVTADPNQLKERP